MPGHYERLSFLDNSFLALESRTAHMHVAGVAIFEAGPLAGPEGTLANGRNQLAHSNRAMPSSKIDAWFS